MNDQTIHPCHTMMMKLAHELFRTISHAKSRLKQSKTLTKIFVFAIILW
jgi:hypothetical protein